MSYHVTICMHISPMLMLFALSLIYFGLYTKHKKQKIVCAQLSSRGCLVVVARWVVSLPALHDHACGNACYPFALIASAFGGYQVFYTNCGGLWHRTRADGSAFVSLTHTHYMSGPEHWP
jgi:hypothetical protein